MFVQVLWTYSVLIQSEVKLVILKENVSLSYHYSGLVTLMPGDISTLTKSSIVTGLQDSLEEKKDKEEDLTISFAQSKCFGRVHKFKL